MPGRRIPSLPPPPRGEVGSGRGPPPGRLRPPSGAFPPERCAATGSGSAGKASDGQVARRPSPGGGCYSPPAAALAASRGRGRRPPPRPPPPPAPRRRSRRRPPRGGRRAGGAGAGACGGRAPPPPTRLSPGTDCPQCAPTASRRRAGSGRAGRTGSAATSAAPPTRLETRTKESNTRASQRLQTKAPWRNEGEGRRAPAEVGSRGLRAEGAPPARLARPVGEVERERAC